MDVLWQVTGPLGTRTVVNWRGSRERVLDKSVQIPPAAGRRGRGAGSVELSQEPKGVEGRCRLGACLGLHPPQPLSRPTEGPRLWLSLAEPQFPYL